MGDSRWPTDLFGLFAVVDAVCGGVDGDVGDDDEQDILGLLMLLRSRFGLALASESNGVRR